MASHLTPNNVATAVSFGHEPCRSSMGDELSFVSAIREFSGVKGMFLSSGEQGGSYLRSPYQVMLRRRTVVKAMYSTLDGR